MARALRIWLVLAVAASAVALFALASGSSGIAVADVVRVLFDPDGSPAAEIVHQLRLPRAIAAFAAGAPSCLRRAPGWDPPRTPPAAPPLSLALRAAAAGAACG